MASTLPEYVSSDDQVRLLARVARMYHEQGMRQGEIAKRLQISQPRVSRLLKRAVEVGIVRTTVSIPAGVNTDLEERLESEYGLSQAVIVDAADEDVTSAVGTAAAEYLSATLTGGDNVGISSWSATLLAAVNAMHPFKKQVVNEVVQLVGGQGTPRVQMQATRLIGQLASLTGAEPVLLSSPAMLSTSEGAASLLTDPAVSGVVAAWERLSIALVGIGAAEPSDLARESGNTFPAEDRAELRRQGAVGDICFRFFDAEGQPIVCDFDDRVIGISRDQLRSISRRVGVAGGSSKTEAIRSALVGGWINVLVTDSRTARALVTEKQ